MSAKFLRQWARDTFLTSGTMSGQTTKQDAGATLAAQGFVPGTPSAARHLNFELNALIESQRRYTEIAALMPRVRDVASDVTNDRMAVVYMGDRHLVAWTSSTGIVRVWDYGPSEIGGSVAPLTILNGLARKPNGLLVAVGFGGNNNVWSNDDGDTWTNGGAIAAVTRDVIFNPIYSRFQAISTGAVYSTDGTSWTSVALSGITRDLALLPNGNVITTTGSGPITMAMTTNGGTSWAASGTLSNAADYTSAGALAGAGVDNVYHAGKLTSGGAIRISMTEDGTTWTGIATISASDFVSGSSGFKLMQCPQTGMLVLFVRHDTQPGHALYMSTDQGVTWSDPIQMADGYDEFRVGVANGKVFVLDGGATPALGVSDGIGE